MGIVKILKCVMIVTHISFHISTSASAEGAKSGITSCTIDPVTGDECASDDRFGACVGGKCVCSSEASSDSVFLDSTQTCYVKGGSGCATGAGNQKCIPNSQCFKSICKCNNDLKLNSEGRCFLPYDETCDRGKDLCDPAAYLYCGLNTKCACNNSEATIYDESDKTCRILSGSACDPDPNSQKCVENSDCDVGTKTCKCLSDFVETDDKLCAKNRLGYDESCEPGALDLCDDSEYLECSSNKCACKNPTETFYDHITKKCYLLENSVCEADEQQCAPNSECINKICKCNERLTRNGERRCFLTYADSCDFLNDLCDPVTFLHCGLHKKCDCANPGNTTYEPSDSSCRILAGSQCTSETTSKFATSPNQLCVINADCDDTDNLCICDSNFHANESGSCVPDTLDYGESCEQDNDKCDSEKFLHCNSNSLCDCQYDNSIYDVTTKMCYYLADADCTQNDRQECIPNAKCDNDGKCQCNDGLFPNEQNFCHVKYQNKCNRTSHADLCDPLQFLECGLHGICECQRLPETWYNSTSKKCEILAHGHCSPNPGMQECVVKAECELGYCKCIDNFHANSSNFCTLGHGGNCNENIVGKTFCNPEKYFECNVNGRCICMNYGHSYYDEKTDYCYLKAGAMCITGEQKCGQNSKCAKSDTGFKCTCDDGLIPNENNRCFLAHNSSCSSNHDLCDPDGFLKCGLNQKCQCNSKNSFYNPDSKKCQLLAESECYLDGREQCVENAACLMTTSGIATCHCMGDFKPDAEGECRLFHGSQCSRQENLCDSKNFLNCSEFGRCECQNPLETYYDPYTIYCYSLAETRCNSSENAQKCILNSYCDLFTHTCQCNNDVWPLEVNKIGHCTLSYEKNCSTENDLCDKNAFFQCSTEKECGCSHPNKTWYNPLSSRCEIREGNSCSLNSSTSQQCYFNSECQPIGGGGSNEYTCMCVDNLTPNMNGLCHLKHGQVCQLDSNDYCDPAAFLSCELPLKKCECNIPNTFFNQLTNSCERLAGGACLTNENEPQCILNSHCDIFSRRCTCDDGFEFSQKDNACLKSHDITCQLRNECNGENQLDCIGGKCICKEGYFPYYENETAPIKCLPGYLQSCNLQFPCYVDSNLMCTPDGLCQCLRPDEQVFDPEKIKCVGLVGTACILDDIQNGNLTNTNCVANSDCVLNSSLNDTDYGVCSCNDGYQPNSNQICISSSAWAVEVSSFFIAAIYTLVVSL